MITTVTEKATSGYGTRNRRRTAGYRQLYIYLYWLENTSLIILKSLCNFRIILSFLRFCQTGDPSLLTVEFRNVIGWQFSK